MGGDKRRVKTVLLVEDDELLLKYWVRELKREGLDVLAARDCASAMELARVTRPDAAIIDCFLEHGNALPLLRALKALHPSVYIVMVSANLSDALSAHGMRNGADFCMMKSERCLLIVRLIEQGRVPKVDDDKRLTLYEHEWELISATLIECNDNITHAADRLGVYRETLRRKLQKRGVLTRANAR